MRKRWIAILAVLVLVASSWACGSTDTESNPTDKPEPAATAAADATAVPETSPTDVPEPEPTDEPGPTELYLGDAIEADGIILAGLTIEDPTTPGMFYEATEGKKLIAIEVIVGNAGEEPLSVNPLNATLLDTEGFTYEPELAGREGGQQLATVNLSYGEKARGWIAFEMDTDATPASIKYSPSLFSTDFVQASLTPPPAGHEPMTDPLSILPPAVETGLGETVEDYGYSLSATTIEDPTAPGIFYNPQPGTRLVAIEITVGNVSGDTLSVNPLYAYLVDSDGHVYEVELGGRDEGGQLATVDLATGEKVKGWVAFQVPEDATPASVKYVLGIFEDEFLQVGLE